MVQKLILLGIGIVVCVVGLIATKYICSKLLKRKSGIYIKFINSVISVGIIAAGIYYSLSLFELTKGISKTLMTSSALILAIATFAAQQALGNVISGFSLSLSKAYSIGDKVKVINGSNIVAEGLVSDTTIRHTVIKTFDGQEAIIPNSIMDNSVILNANYSAKCGNFVEVEVSYDSDMDKATDIFKRICIEHEKTLNDDSMKVMANRFTEDGIVLKTTIWTNNLDDNFAACSDIRKSLVKEFSAAGITIPYKTITISNN